MSKCLQQDSAAAGKGKDVPIAELAEKALQKSPKTKKTKRGGNSGEDEADGKQGDTANDSKDDDEPPVSTFLRSGVETQSQLQETASDFELHDTY